MNKYKWFIVAGVTSNACAECARRAARSRATLPRELEPCDRVMETIDEDAEAELELGNFCLNYNKKTTELETWINVIFSEFLIRF